MADEILQLNLTPEQAVVVSIMYTVGSYLLAGDFTRAIDYAANASPTLHVVSRHDKQEAARQVSTLTSKLPERVQKKFGFTIGVDNDVPVITDPQ
jgi:hypothetical protein